MVEDTALTCPHCGRILGNTAQPSPEGEKLKWYFRKPVIIIALCCLGPLALPLVWWRPYTKPAWKIGITVVIGVLTWLSIVATMKSIESIIELYELMQGI